MTYLDYAIFSPNVVFFRNEKFGLLEEPQTASVLTLPAVNMGQVILKHENVAQAKKIMRHRMELCLELFRQENIKQIILGAYGCSVFCNSPIEVAHWWSELLKRFQHLRIGIPIFLCISRILFPITLTEELPWIIILLYFLSFVKIPNSF